MSFSEWISPLLGRWLLAWFFLSDAWMRAGHWNGTLALMTMEKVPAAPLLLTMALIVLFLGGIALVLGYHTRHAALMLFGYVVVVTLWMHDFWHMAGDLRDAQYDLFARNVAIAGGLLVLVGVGPGSFAVDNRGGR